MTITHVVIMGRYEKGKFVEYFSIPAFSLDQANSIKASYQDLEDNKVFSILVANYW